MGLRLWGLHVVFFYVLSCESTWVSLSPHAPHWVHGDPFLFSRPRGRYLGMSLGPEGSVLVGWEKFISVCSLDSPLQCKVAAVPPEGDDFSSFVAGGDPSSSFLGVVSAGGMWGVGTLNSSYGFSSGSVCWTAPRSHHVTLGLSSSSLFVGSSLGGAILSLEQLCHEEVSWGGPPVSGVVSVPLPGGGSHWLTHGSTGVFLWGSSVPAEVVVRRRDIVAAYPLEGVSSVVVAGPDWIEVFRRPSGGGSHWESSLLVRELSLVRSLTVGPGVGAGGRDIFVGQGLPLALHTPWTLGVWPHLGWGASGIALGHPQRLSSSHVVYDMVVPRRGVLVTAVGRAHGGPESLLVWEQGY